VEFSQVYSAREIFAQSAFEPFRGHEISPTMQHRRAPVPFIRDHVTPITCGTCKMGAVDDPMSVVDPQARVIVMEHGWRQEFNAATNGREPEWSNRSWWAKVADHIPYALSVAACERRAVDSHPNWETSANFVAFTVI
jgi:choline dehydrogenase